MKPACDIQAGTRQPRGGTSAGFFDIKHMMIVGMCASLHRHVSEASMHCAYSGVALLQSVVLLTIILAGDAEKVFWCLCNSCIVNHQGKPAALIPLYRQGTVYNHNHKKRSAFCSVTKKSFVRPSPQALAQPGPAYPPWDLSVPAADQADVAREWLQQHCGQGPVW